MSARVALLMGSDSDYDRLEPCVKTLRELGIDCEVRVLSAHRTPGPLVAVRRDRARARHPACCCAPPAARRTWPASSPPTPTCRSSASPWTTRRWAAWTRCCRRCRCPAACRWRPSASAPAVRSTRRSSPARILALSDPDLARRVAAHRGAQAEAVAKKDARLQARLG